MARSRDDRRPDAQLTPQLDALSIVPRDLSPVTSRDRWDVLLTEQDLLDLLNQLRRAQLGLDSERTGGL